MKITQLSKYTSLKIGAGILLLFSFQNCGKGFKSINSSTDLSSTGDLSVPFAAPELTMQTMVPALSNSRDLDLDFELNKDPRLTIKSVTCQLNTAAPTDCKSLSLPLKDLPDGDYTLRINAEDSSGRKAQELVSTFRIDATAPTLTVSSAPPAVTGPATATFVFTASDDLSGILITECSIDGSAFAPCTSAKDYPALPVAPHTVKIRAKDKAENFTEYSYTWTILISAPVLTISAKPETFVNNGNATFAFNGTDAGQPITVFECQVDGVVTANCVSPKVYSGLAAGTHIFSLRGRTALGVMSSPVTATWTVDLAPPTTPALSSNISGTVVAGVLYTKTTTASLSFNSTDAGSGIASYQCTIDGINIACLTSPLVLPNATFPNIGPGLHTFKVTATDKVGNPSAVGTYVWNVDTTAPTVPTNLAATVISTSQINLSWSAATDVGGSGGITYRVYQGGALVTTTAATNYQSTGLSASTLYSYTVDALDAVSNPSAKTSAVSATTMAGTPPPPPPPPGNIVPSIVPTRITGVAPLAVYFNSTATTDTAFTSKPFHDLEYKWNFGDTASGAYAYGSNPGANSRNLATGPVAAHVFETPGTYTVTLNVLDGTNAASTTVQIAVVDPNAVFSGTNTVCVGTVLPTAGAGGCPTGAATLASASFSTALKTYAGTGKRVLFRRGDSFTASASSTITVTGPGLIGAFGTGAKPAVTATANLGSDGIIGFGGQGFPNSKANLKDWRVMDLSFNGGNNSEVLAHNGGFDQLTYLRVDATNCGDGCFMFNGDLLDYYDANGNPGHHVWTEISIADCTLSDPGSWSLYLWAKNFSLLGNSFDNKGNGSHTVRIIAGINGVISNSLFANNGTASDAGNHTLKFHAPGFKGTALFPAGTYSENVVISDSKFVPSNSDKNNWTVAVDPQDDTEDERMRNIIFERNLMLAGAKTNIGVSIQATNVSIRNNIYNGTGAAAGIFVTAAKRSSGAPAPSAISVYNNTMYSSSNNLSSAEPFISVENVAAGGVTVKNNLGYAPNATAAVADTGAGVVASNNSTNAQMKINPGFASATPSALGDFKIQAGSYAIGAGTLLPVWSDILRVAQPAARDLGAFVH